MKAAKEESRPSKKVKKSTYYKNLQKIFSFYIDLCTHLSTSIHCRIQHRCVYSVQLHQPDVLLSCLFFQVTYDDDDDDDDDIDWEMSSDSSSSESDGGEGPGTTVYTAAMFLKKQVPTVHCSNSYSLICVDLKVNLVKIYMYVYLLTENSTGNHHDIFLHYESFYF